VPVAASGQTIILKTGQQVETSAIRRSGDKIMGRIDVGGTSGEVGYDLNTIARIQFPEPRGIRSAQELLSQGQPEKALAEVTPIINFYTPFKDVPGGWWAAAAVVKVSALAALQRHEEAEPLAREIQKIAPDPEAARAANLRIAAALVAKQDFEKAAEICDEAIRQSARPGVLADAWVLKGHMLLAQKEWDAALLAYLRVPVFYPEERLFMPPACSAAAALIAALMTWNARRNLLMISSRRFRKSAEAALAQPNCRSCRSDLISPRMKLKIIYLAALARDGVLALFVSVAFSQAATPAPAGGGDAVTRRPSGSRSKRAVGHDPIGLCSVATLYLIGDGVMRTSRKRVAPTAHEESVKSLFRQGDYVGAYNFCKENPSPLTNVLRVGG
jgi:tetratricopeptide (TPR) repeat protein